MYPPLEPHAHGWLDAGGGQRVYWEACGNPLGRPALVVHGGPGSGCSPGARRYFDPARYRIILFDQRGSGRSTPHAGAAGVDLSANTTAALLEDMESLRRHLGISGWVLLGGSWGATLALAYAQRHPGRVAAMVLFSVATTTRREIDWITRGVGAFFPREWARFRDGVPGGERDGCLASAYHRLLMHPDPAVQDKAARDWCDWEMAIVPVAAGAVAAGHAPHPRYADAGFRLGFARLVTWYWSHAAWLEEDALLHGMGALAGIPGVLIHGRLDFGSPLLTAWQLAQAWEGSVLEVVEAAGHDARDPGMGPRIVAALDRLATAPASAAPPARR